MAMSKSYTEKAATYRAEAAYHKEMAKAYAKAHQGSVPATMMGRKK